jgi:hypothetical protein
MCMTVALTAVSLRALASHCCIRGSCAGDAGAGSDPFDRGDACGGSVPGADGDPFDRGDPFEGSVPGADGDPFDREGPCGGSVPGADDDHPFDPVLRFAAKLVETPAPISATVARAASGRSFLLMFHSFVW